MCIPVREHRLRSRPLGMAIFPFGNFCLELAPAFAIILPYGNAGAKRLKYTPEQIGKLIRETRKSLGVTQKSLALASGTGLRFVIDLERGKETCELGKTLTILHTLGIKLALTPPSARGKEQ